MLVCWGFSQAVLAQTSFTAELNGAKMYYEVAGQGQPVVLIHGFSLDSRMWDAQWKTLAKRFKVVRYDVRGFGQSARVQAPHAPADDLKALLDHLKIGKAHLVGLSMGANIALNFAARYPDRVLRVVAADPNLDGFMDYTPELFAAFGQVFGLSAQHGWGKEAQEAWLNTPLMKLYTADASMASALRRMVSEYNGDQFINPGLAPDYGKPSTVESLPAVKAPVLVLIGEKDEESIQRVARLVAEKAPQAQKQMLKGAGHLSNMDQPKAFNKAVMRFLK